MKLPTEEELYEKGKNYVYNLCELQNFCDEDECELIILRYMDGYIKAIRDNINSNYLK